VPELKNKEEVDFMTARVIDHQQAIKKMMAERYLLGELTEGDLDAFEEHLFECTVCFEQVKAGTEFVDYLKRIGTQPDVEPARQGWIPRLNHALGNTASLVFAGLFLCAVCLNLYQGMVNQRLGAAHNIVPVTLHEQSRGESAAAGPEVTPSPAGYIDLWVSFEAKAELTDYRAEIKDQAGKTVESAAINKQDESIQLSVYKGKFHSGKYTMVVTAADPASSGRKQVKEYPFVVKLQD
jgi:Putative zinc-finger